MIKKFISSMTNYEKARLAFQVIQIIVTIAVPFIAIWFNRILNES